MSNVVPLRTPDVLAAPEAEAAVLSACTLDPARIAAVAEVLSPADFNSLSNQRIWSALLRMHSDGVAIDVASLASVLREKGDLDKVGGTPYLLTLVDATPAVAHVVDHAEIVRDCARRRWAAGRLTELAAQARSGDPLEGLLAGAREFVSRAEAEERSALPVVGVDGIFDPLPAVPWVCRALDLCPGAPILVAGFGFSGKTVAVQSLALSIAAGLPVWGTFEARKGRVLHVDYEQGDRLTRERYQRLAAGLMVGPSDLGDRLSLSCMPSLYLDGSASESVLCRALDDYTLAIFDSLRASAPSVEENSSEVRRVLDVLTRVSEKTGCATLVIHHARKPQKDAAGGAKASIRGSGAIYDACSSVLVFEASKGMPTTVSHEKARTSGVLAEDFSLTIADVPNGGDERWGLIVSAEACPTVPTTRDTSEEDGKVLEVIRENPGATGRQVWSALPDMRREAFLNALARLEMTGRIVGKPGRNRAMHWHITENGGSDAA